jgi:hypothetical protein
VHNRAPLRADDGEHVLVEVDAPFRRAEVDDASAAAVEVDDLDRVRAGLKVEAGDALRVAARAAALPEFTYSKLPREEKQFYLSLLSAGEPYRPYQK